MAYVNAVVINLSFTEINLFINLIQIMGKNLQYLLKNSIFAFIFTRSNYISS